MPAQPGRLRLLSFNVQTGIATSSYRHYLTRSWRHVVPHGERFATLNRIAGVIRDYDIVGLQEVDAGSLRSGFINLTEYLAMRARFPYWYDQTNREVGGIARHALGVLSRYQCAQVREHRLPGPIPGRGALCLRFGDGPQALTVLILHLALGRRARRQQLDYLIETLAESRHVVVMGDLNFPSRSAEMDYFIRRSQLSEPIHGLHTFPSWRPERNIDHILVSPGLRVAHAEVLNHPISDHLPIAMELCLPEGLVLQAGQANVAGLPAELPG